MFSQVMTKSEKAEKAEKAEKEVTRNIYTFHSFVAHMCENMQKKGK